MPFCKQMPKEGCFSQSCRSWAAAECRFFHVYDEVSAARWWHPKQLSGVSRECGRVLWWILFRSFLFDFCTPSSSRSELAYNNLFASADIIYGRRLFYQGDLAGDNIALRGNNISASHTNWHYAVYQLPTWQWEKSRVRVCHTKEQL